MSLDAYRWAWQQRCEKSMDKFVLVAMADRADEQHCCFPSVLRLSRDTQLDRKTVIVALARLEKLHLIRDTGERKGRTKKVKVYQLMGVDDRHASAATAVMNTPQNGTVKSTQHRNDSNNGTVPVFPANDPKNGTPNDPKNGTQNLPEEPIKETTSIDTAVDHADASVERYKGIALVNLPADLSVSAAKHFIDHRKAMKKPLTQHGFQLYLKALEACREVGIPLDAVVDETIDAGWQSIKPAWLIQRLQAQRQTPGASAPDTGRPRKALVA